MKFITLTLSNSANR